MELKQPSIYVDANATTPLHPRVRDAMAEVLEGPPANPSSLHGFGRRARRLVEEAREKVAACLGVPASSLYFTSGGSESNNLAVYGLVPAEGSLWAGAGVHPSVMEPCRDRWRQGMRGGVLPIDGAGRAEPETLSTCGDVTGGLVTLEWVNNETGVIQPLAAWCEAVHQSNAWLHIDGAQGFFRINDRILGLGIDAATITAHKSFGPHGVGVLYVRQGLVIDPLLSGGPQERQVRPGTENVAAIHGLGVLATLADRGELWPQDVLAERWSRFRARLAAIPGAHVVTPAQAVFPNTVNVAFPGLEAETILVRLDMAGVAASSGSACSSGARQPSRVLKAMGIPDDVLRGAVRFSFTPATTVAELDLVADRAGAIVADLRRRRG